MQSVLVWFNVKCGEGGVFVCSFRLYWKLMMSPSHSEEKEGREGELSNSQDNRSEEQRHDITQEGEREDRYFNVAV